MTTPVAQISGLTVRFGDITVIDDLTLSIDPQTRVGLIGESGSGKSLTAAALLGLLPHTAHASGSVKLRGQEMLNARENKWRNHRGNTVGLVAQDPRTALNTLVKIGAQVAEPLRAKGVSTGEARAKAVDLLRAVRLPSPEQIAERYPTQLSGGQRQRVAIAMALAAEPDLLIADEPTSSLDVTVQAEILPTLGAVTSSSALLFITHDISVATLLCERLVVLQRGIKVADGTTSDIVSYPPHPYVEQLLEASRSTALPASCESLTSLTTMRL